MLHLCYHQVDQTYLNCHGNTPSTFLMVKYNHHLTKKVVNHQYNSKTFKIMLLCFTCWKFTAKSDFVFINGGSGSHHKKILTSVCCSTHNQIRQPWSTSPVSDTDFLGCC